MRPRPGGDVVVTPDTSATSHVLNVDGLDALLQVVRGEGYTLIGPTRRDGAIVFDAVAGVDDLPRGWTDQQEGGTYRLVPRDDDALALIDAHDDTADPSVEVVPRRAVGHGASEAPRGLLYHRYEIDDDGSVLAATIIPPTSQNQAQVEDDLRRFVEPRLEMDHHELTHQCEQAIRNYDPCISCATHVLDLTVVHE